MTTETDTTSTAARSADTNREKRPFFWEREHRADLPDGADLAALRRGVGREPGSVPQMWQYYTTLQADGHLTTRLRAEHAALTLFAIHQQSLPRSAHELGSGLGTAVKELRASGKFSPDAVDRRFGTAATATSLSEASYHLRGLVRQLRQIQRPLDYTALFWDLVTWQNPARLGQVRRRWAAQYFLNRDSEGAASASASRR